MTDCQEARPGGLQEGTNEQVERQKSLRPPDFSDAGNAEVFSRSFRHNLVYTDALGWFWWDGKRWERNEHKALSLAIDLSGRMLREADAAQRTTQVRRAELLMAVAQNPDAVDGSALDASVQALRSAIAFHRHAQKLRNARQLNNMVELAKPSFVLKADRLDANPLDLNTPAGIVNLATGELRPHERMAFCSRMT
ncbi:MAG: hypothetical protein IJT94_10280, partial [Oscillibacter sp.]|nr:hypothetical protein [Oscillibacter sp.]